MVSVREVGGNEKTWHSEGFSESGDYEETRPVKDFSDRD
jgi:hypothetical protein